MSFKVLIPQNVAQVGKDYLLERGYDNVDVKAAAELGIWATNAPMSNANAVAEHTIV